MDGTIQYEEFLVSWWQGWLVAWKTGTTWYGVVAPNRKTSWIGNMEHLRDTSWAKSVVLSCKSKIWHNYFLSFAEGLSMKKIPFLWDGVQCLRACVNPLFHVGFNQEARTFTNDDWMRSNWTSLLSGDSWIICWGDVICLPERQEHVDWCAREFESNNHRIVQPFAFGPSVLRHGFSPMTPTREQRSGIQRCFVCGGRCEGHWSW